MAMQSLKWLTVQTPQGSNLGKEFRCRIKKGDLLLGATILCLSFLALRSPGTSDIAKAFVPWVEGALKHGFISNYQNQVTAYPPAYILIPFLLAKYLGIQAFWAYKTFLVISLLLVIYAGSKALGLRMGLILGLIFIYPSLVLGYGDSLIVAILLLIFINLESFKYYKVGVLVGLVISIKFTPIIIIPIIIIYIFRKDNFSFPKSLSIIKLGNLTKTFMGFLLWEIPLVLFTGLEMFVNNLKLALLNGYLSGNAPNMGWIITKIKMGPNSIPSYVGDTDLIRFIYIDVHSGLYRGMKFVAMLVAVFLIMKSFQFENSLENNALLISLTLFAYYEFAPGVHENHLTLAIPFALILVKSQEKRRKILGFSLILISLVNLFSFYTLKGNYNESRIVFGMDFSLALATIETSYAIVLVGLYLVNSLNLTHGQGDGENGGGIKIPRL